MRSVATTWTVALAAIVLLTTFGAVAAQRPRFHVRPPKNWINDPNGPYRDPITKTMHIFMQYNPNSSVWGDINWYHFTSQDYVKWKDQGIALTNGETYDHFGAFSGSITQNVNGSPVLMYTCTADGNEQRQCIAVPPTEDIKGVNAPRTLKRFTKLAPNPVLNEMSIPGLVGKDNFRDPTNFWPNPDNASEWLVAFVARINDTDNPVGDGHVVVFSTSDPTWRSGFNFSHSIWNDTDDFYHMLECPDFFKLGGDYFMKLSTMITNQDFWVYGEYGPKNSDNQTIYAQDPARSPTYIDYGAWYASKQNHDPILNRTILWGWIREEISETDMRKQGWSGMMDMPRDMKYDATAKKMKTYPMPELQKLRMRPLVANMKLSIASNSTAAVIAQAGQHYELVVDFTLPVGAMASGNYKVGEEPSFGVDVLTSADHSKYTRFEVKMAAVVAAGMNQTGRQYKFVNATNSTECEETCHAERRCVAWTFVANTTTSCALMSTFGEVFGANESTSSGRTSDPVILLNRTHSGTTGSMEPWVGRAPLWNGTKVQLRVFVDGTAVQVFKDGGLESLTARVYTENTALTGISLFSQNIAGPVQAVATLYPMDTVYVSSPADASLAPVSCGALLVSFLLLVQLALLAMP